LTGRVKNSRLQASLEVRGSERRRQRFAGPSGVHYGANVTDVPRDNEVVGRRAPDLILESPTGAPFRLGDALTRGPVVLFFFIHGGTPG